MASKLNHRRIGIAIIALAVYPGAGSDEVWAAPDAEPLFVEGAVFAGGLDEKALAEQSTPRRLDPRAPIGHAMRLAPFDLEAALAKSVPAKGPVPLKIGSHREMPAALQVEMGARDLEWEDARGGGQVAVFSVTSPGAKAVRVALDFERLPRGAEVRFYSPVKPVAEGGSFDAGFLAPRRPTKSAAEPFWSPVIGGETAVVEVWVPRWRRAADVRLTVRRVSHIYKDLAHVGNSGGCNRDVLCLKKWEIAGNAVAKIIFETGFGSALCTGQLVNNPDGKLLFLTAAHCISTKSSAKSTVFFWFFQRSACNGNVPNGVIQTAGGGRLLFTAFSRSQGLATDNTLMRLKRNPPNGVSLMGFTTADLESLVGEKVHGVHHPAGDLKMVSRGKTRDTWRQEADDSLSQNQPHTHVEVVWNLGTTEGGSSGSFLATGKKFPNQFVVGVLTRGAASCSNRKGPDFYGSFQVTYDDNRKFRKHFQ